MSSPAWNRRRRAMRYERAAKLARRSSRRTLAWMDLYVAMPDWQRRYVYAELYCDRVGRAWKLIP